MTDKLAERQKQLSNDSDAPREGRDMSPGMQIASNANCYVFKKRPSTGHTPQQVREQSRTELRRFPHR
jgi:hypothetical protein